MSVEILAIAAHRDDVEQTCGGTLLKMASLGHSTGILDLTRGELGTRGTAEDREREAIAAAKILKVSWRAALDIPDGRVENTWENRLKVARVIREQRGTGGFGYDVVFVPDDQDGSLTSAEMSSEQKDAISHRGKSLRAIAPIVAATLG